MVKDIPEKEFNGDLSGYKFFSEGGRIGFLYPNFLFSVSWSIKNHDFAPSKNTFLTSSSNHLFKWYSMIEDSVGFQEVLDKAIKDETFLDRLEAHTKKTKEKVLKKIKNVDFRNISDKELEKILLFYYQQFAYMVLAAANGRSIDHSVVLHLRKELKDHSNIDELIAVLSTSKKETFSLAEEKALLKISIYITEKDISLDSKEVEKRINKIKDKFCWSTRGYFDEKSQSLEDYIKRIKELIKENPKKLLNNILDRINNDLKKREETLKGMDKNIKKLADIAAAATYIKDHYKSSVNEVIHFADPLFEEVAKRTKRKADFIKDLLPYEVLDLLHGKDINSSEIKKRIKKNIIFNLDGKIYVLSGSKAEEFNNKYMTKKENKKAEFKGRVTCIGKAKGKAKIVLGAKDFKKIEKGDILVVLNTTPDFVPLLKKAGAVVAEEGGITAHVSVISREMGIPCIVGIDGITDILKDGDKVEVDAIRGLVKKIK